MSYYVDKNLHKYSPVISGGFRNEMSKVELPNKIITFFAILLCSGLFSNNISYIIIVPFIIMLLTKAQVNFSKNRIYFICVTIMLILFGSLKGYFRGNDIEYIIRFSFPLLVFVVFCSIPGIGLVLFNNRLIISIFGLFLTAIFFYLIKTSNFEITDAYMAGWTVTYSSNAGVSIWHYFLLPFHVSIIFEGFSKLKYNKMNVIPILIGFTSILLLLILTDTSSFLLALIIICVILLLPFKFSRFLAKFTAFFLIILMFEFLTVGMISKRISSWLFEIGANDAGDYLRAIQFNYFAEQAEFFGSGFGAIHDFPFELNQARQLSQLLYPYASELPILNIIFNGGVLAAVWFSLILIVFVKVVAKTLNQEEKPLRYFVIGCVGVLIGSLSNPFLFAPGSMLLLAIAFDLVDAPPIGRAARFASS
jgi:hypothetical protein